MKTIKRIGNGTFLPLTRDELARLGVGAGEPVEVHVTRGRITVTPSESLYSRTLAANRRTRARYRRTLDILRDA